MSTSIATKPQKTALYRHYDKDNVLLYVGISISAMERFRQHKSNSEWAYKSSIIKTEWFDSRSEALLAEKEAIILECPRYNIVHSSQLSRCPFCGGSASYSNEGDGNHYVGCDDESMKCAVYFLGKSRDDVMHRWNTRISNTESRLIPPDGERIDLT